MTKLLILFGIFAFVHYSTAQSQSTVAVQFCPLYLALQNRCPSTTTTTPLPTTTRRTTPSENANGNSTNSDEADVTDSCGFPVITFCPAMQLFLSGGRTCTGGQTIRVNWTTLQEVLISPTEENAAAAVGARYVDEFGETLTSVSKSIQQQATPTQATIGVTFIPVGQIIG